MSKIFYVLNDRNDTSKGYTEVTQEFVKKYIDSFTEGRAYFINLGYAVMETDEANYKAFYKERRRERYIIEEAIKNGEVSFDALDSSNFDENAEDAFAVDDSEPLEEKIMRKIMLEKLPEALSILADDEKELIQQIYFNHISERELAGIYGVSHTAIQKRRNRILLKLKNYFEN